MVLYVQNKSYDRKYPLTNKHLIIKEDLALNITWYSFMGLKGG